MNSELKEKLENALEEVRPKVCCELHFQDAAKRLRDTLAKLEDELERNTERLQQDCADRHATAEAISAMAAQKKEMQERCPHVDRDGHPHLVYVPTEEGCSYLLCQKCQAIIDINNPKFNPLFYAWFDESSARPETVSAPMSAEEESLYELPLEQLKDMATGGVFKL